MRPLLLALLLLLPGCRTWTLRSHWTLDHVVAVDPALSDPPRVEIDSRFAFDTITVHDEPGGAWSSTLPGWWFVLPSLTPYVYPPESRAALIVWNGEFADGRPGLHVHQGDEATTVYLYAGAR